MSTLSGKHVPRALGELLARLPGGGREFEQIAAVLVTAEAVAGSKPHGAACLCSNLWVAGDSAFIVWPPRAVANQPADSPVPHWTSALGHGSLWEDVRRLVSLVPGPLPGAACSQAEHDQVVAAVKGPLKKLERIEVWSEAEITQRLLQLVPLALRYLPDEVPNGHARLKRIDDTRQAYDTELAKLYGKVQFIGMSVYKEEAAASVSLERIYIPLRVIPEGAVDDPATVPGINPLALLAPGDRQVILGDPGSGKSTLLKFLALAGTHPELRKRYGTEQDLRLPILVTLRRYADGLKDDPDLSLLDYILKVTPDDLDLTAADREFFEHYLYAGQALLLLDGVDELPGPEFKDRVRGRVQALLARYPGNAVLVTTRIVGYEKEARYDALGFSHHCVARLSLGEIETFMGDWYAARIESRKERERHASDLVRIVRDEDSRAIRELAENPLLLTIICLVHRIDAVLPDERVILYEKCTETLLNTWHAWRFRPEEAKTRSKIERRNRARMEALAYWMHSALAEEKTGRRAVVPLAEMVAFLSEYIETIEKPRGAAPRALAEEFLRFVRERAGLLIEAGSGHYSFVHLTFQEYLAATYLRKTGEPWGLGVVWDVVKDRCADARWHEVIRLLVAALERVESQVYLIERILDEPTGSKSLGRAVLAGGCLLDSVEAGEDMREEIVARLLAGAVSAESVAALRQPLRILRAWQERDLSHRTLIANLVTHEDAQATSATVRIGLALLLYCLGWEHEEVRRATRRLHEEESSAARLAGALGLTNVRGERSRFSGMEIRALDSAIAMLSLTSIRSNVLAAGLTALFFDGRSNAMSSLFSQLLMTLVEPSGPFVEWVRFLVLLAPKAYSPPLELARARALDRYQDSHRVRDLVQALARARDGVLDRALDWFRDRAGVRDLDPNRDLARARARALDLDLDLQRNWGPALGWGRGDNVAWCKGILVEPDLYSPLLDIACDRLKLEPKAVWWEALRLRVLPALPRRIALMDPEEWARVETVLVEDQATPPDRAFAACLLLFDIWMWITECYPTPEESPFARLATITREDPLPELRVAHCLRGIAFGNQQRIKDIKAMVNSNKPELKQLFVDALWRDPPTGKATFKEKG